MPRLQGIGLCKDSVSTGPKSQGIFYFGSLPVTIMFFVRRRKPHTFCLLSCYGFRDFRGVHRSGHCRVMICVISADLITIKLVISEISAAFIASFSTSRCEPIRAPEQRRNLSDLLVLFWFNESVIVFY